ncbi:uncharacterized protein Dana_GF23618 [Drosophila ananassae]|uniref:Uncharacterized protein n=1 Tax=Drosophila ananassae TaxID=7217 RepID=B3M8B6_DROAN|nr:uncharacterized protein LOC6506259 [Drosophila ananassae]EDV41055.1 uncharacterized protein Dana_GF23618 [Drosophila ananassae]
MRPKEHSELSFDVIPKLYDANIKVFLTSLFRVEEQLQPLPRKFCRMYTTEPLAHQLLDYLASRGGQLSMQNFHLVEDCQPFELQLSFGRKVEVMLCNGSHLNNSLILLIRRPQGGRLLYCYSAVRMDNLGRLLGNPVFNSWISRGTERLYLNLSSGDEPFEHLDFEEMAKQIQKDCIQNNHVLELMLPHFGYEELIWNLGHTRLYGQIRLMGTFGQSYKHLSSDLNRFQCDNNSVKINVSMILDCEAALEALHTDSESRTVTLPLHQLKWTPLPTRMHLRQMCSLLRPQHIDGIVTFHSAGNIPQVPEFLRCFKEAFVEKSQKLKVPQTSPKKVGAPANSYRVLKKNPITFADDGSESD